MGKQRELKWMVVAFILGILIMVPSGVVYADTGPKPSVVLQLNGIEAKEYYVTLLSDKMGYGPWNNSKTVQESFSHIESLEQQEIWNALNEYQLNSEYYFIGYFEECSESGTFTWGYFPPERFKILVYLPEENRFIESKEVYERYAFDSYYTVNVNKDTGEILATKSYDFTMELRSFFLRVFITIGIEIGIALLLFLHRKKLLMVIIVTNIVTQLILNVYLNAVNYTGGSSEYYFKYLLIEGIIIVIEGMIYSAARKEFHEKGLSSRVLWGYAIGANVISFIAGMGISLLLPGIVE